MANKRPDGDGLVRKRSDGRWEGRIVVGHKEDGKPKTKNVLAKTKAECRVKLEELKGKYAPPVTRCKPDMPFGDWMDFWYQNYCKPQLRLNTQLGYEDRIYKHIIPEIGKIPLNQLTQSDLQQFYAKLKASGRLIRVEQYGPGLSDRMVRVCHANCRSALQKAVEEGLIRINPAVGCKLPPKKSGEMNILTQEEMQRFLIQAKQDGEILGYLFGHEEKSERTSSIMVGGTPCFEIEELYVVPSHRSKGVGRMLFHDVEQAVKAAGIDFIMLSTATKNYKSILHFYIDELGMDFWSARLFKKL